MPQVRIPDASLVARADFLLPFLAPRAFTELPPATRKIPQNGKSDEEQQGNARPSAWIQESKGSKQQKLRANGAWPMYPAHARWNEPQAKSPWEQLRLTYSNISYFARQHARTFSTSPNDSKVTTKKVPRHSQRGTGGITRKTTSLRLENSSRRTGCPVSALAQRGSLLALKRKNAMEVQQASLAKYLTRIPPDLDLKGLMRRGHYRSLRRRLFNLRNWNVTQLDLSRENDDATNFFNLISAFAFLDRTVYREFGRYIRKGRIKHNPHCVRLSKKLFSLPRANLARLRNNWLDLDLETRKTWFARLMFYLLDRKSGRALPFIQTLAEDPDLRDSSAKIIADALGHLSKIHCGGKYPISHSWDKNAEVNRKPFLPAFAHIFQNLLVEKFDIFSQDILYNLVELSSIDDLRKMFECLVEYRGKVKLDTLLHYANAFSEAGDIQYALRSLYETKKRHSPDHWASVSQREKVRWSCALILRKSMSKSEDYHAIPGIVAQILNLGVKMDTLLYNVVMRNAMEAGDHATAFKVYNALESSALKPDKITFSILLYGCTLQANPAMFLDFAQHCARVAKEMKDPWLATDVLYYVYVRHQNDPEPRRSDLLWQTYLNFFSAETLKPFLGPQRQPLLDAIENQLSLSESTVFEPTIIALYLIFQTEIKLALAVSNERVVTLYQQFKYFAPSPGLRRLARTLHIWNAFLHAFCLKQQFASASQVIKDMTENNPQPNIYTWNIFMQAFFKTGQVQVAERVFELARNRGVKPDQYSYGVLMRGYAKAQLVEQIGDTMKFIEAKNEMDPDLLRALAKVVNRRKLMLILEKSRLDKEVREREEMERYEKEERARWGMVEPFSEEAEAFSENISTERVQAAEILPGARQTSQAPAITTKEPSLMYQDSTITDHDASSPSPSKSPSAPPPFTHQTQPHSSLAPIALLNGLQSQPQIHLPPSTISKALHNDLQPQPQPQPKPKILEATEPSSIVAPQPQPPPPPPPTPPPPSHLRFLSPNDPELEYRKLQERLGILAPSTLLVEEEKRKRESGGGIGDEMEFGSMLSVEKKVRSEVGRGGGRVREGTGNGGEEKSKERGRKRNVKKTKDGGRNE